MEPDCLYKDGDCFSSQFIIDVITGEAWTWHAREKVTKNGEIWQWTFVCGVYSLIMVSFIVSTCIYIYI